MTRRRVAAALYSRLYLLCVQYSPPVDWRDATALAAQEREDEARREMVEEIRKHTGECPVCHRTIIDECERIGVL